MRPIEDIIADMNALMEGTTGRNLTDDEVGRYEGLERELVAARRDAAIQARHAAYNAPTNAAPRVGAGTPRPEDTVTAAFSNYLRTGQGNMDIAHLRVTNAQQEGTGSTGGYLVPTEFRAKLIERMKAFGGIGNHVETINTTDGRPIEWPTIDDTGNEAEIVAESQTTVGGADIVFGMGQLGAYKYMSNGAGGLPLRVSVELIQDSAFDIDGLVSRVLGQRIARAQAPDLVKGTGVGEPLGLVTGRTPVKTALATGTVTYGDLITWIHSVDPAYRGLGNCKWAFNDLGIAVIEKMVDSHGDPLWRPDAAGLAGDYTSGTLLGYPVIIDQAFDNFAIADSTKIFGAFGDFREGYVRRLVKDVVVIVNPYTRASYGEVEYTAWGRMGGTQVNPNAYVVLSGNS